MNCDFSTLPHDGIKTLSPYVPGRSARELAQERGIRDIIKLASNENPLGCSPRVISALSQLPAEEISIYHPTSHESLRAKLGEKYGMHKDGVFLANGSDAIFPLVLMCFALHRNKHLLVHEYSFNIPIIQAKALGIAWKTVEVNEQGQVEVNKLIEATNESIGLIYLANPNNPTGSYIPKSGIEHILKNIPSCTLFLLDEAYFEFLPDQSMHSLLHQYPNLIITRTFSKAYGLAGLRLGYALADPTVISLLERIVLSFSVNYAALVAGEAALDDNEFLTRSYQSNRQGIAQLQQGLENLNTSFLPIAGNFVTINYGKDTRALFDEMQNHGVIIRPLHPYGLNNYIRVTVGTEHQIQRFLETFAHCKRLNI